MRKINYKRMIYKKKYSLNGILLFLLIFSIDISYKLLKYIANSTIKFIKWYKRYIQFIKSGYSYKDIYNLIMSMSGREFECFMAEIFKVLGYRRVVLTQQTNDGGKDIVLYGDNGITYVETKRWKYELECGRVLLQKLVGSAIADRVDNMIFITTSGYNSNAYEYAKKIDNLELWDMCDIMRIVAKIDQKQIPKILSKSLGDDIKVIKLCPINE